MIESVPFWLAALLIIGALFALEITRRRLNSARRRNETLRRDLDGALSELDSAANLRSELLSRIGQSLKKPLESIRSATEEISRPLECPEWMKEQLGLLSKEIDNIGKFIDLIGEIVTLDKLSGKSASPPLSGGAVTDLEAVLTDVVQASSARLSERGVSMTVAMDTGVLVAGDEGYLRQAFDAIVSETERFAGKGGMVHVDLSAGEGTARISLDYRGSVNTEASPSLLSLELARQIVAGHGGWIQEAAKKGQFTIELPTISAPRGSQGEPDEQRDLQEV